MRVSQERELYAVDILEHTEYEDYDLIQIPYHKKRIIFKVIAVPTYIAYGTGEHYCLPYCVHFLQRNSKKRKVYRVFVPKIWECMLISFRNICQFYKRLL